MYNLFYPWWKIKYSFLPNQLNLSVWCEDLPVLDNSTQSPCKAIKFTRFCRIQEVNVFRLNFRLELKLSVENAKRAIYL